MNYVMQLTVQLFIFYTRNDEEYKKLVHKHAHLHQINIYCVLLTKRTS